MLVEDVWHNLDRTVDLACHGRVLGRAMLGVEREFRRLRTEAIRSSRTIDDFTALRDSELVQSELTQRKIGWLAQRVLPGKCRVWCVGPKLFHARKDIIEVPSAEQLAVIGLAREDIDIAAQYWRCARSTRPAYQRLEAMAVSEDMRTVHLIKGRSFSSLAGRTATTQLVRDYAPLFAADGLILADVKLDAQTANSLFRARQVLSAIFPKVEFRLSYFIVNDDYGWDFQCHDVTGLDQERGLQDSVALKPESLLASSLAYAEDSRRNSDFLKTIDSRGATMDLPRVLQACPVDRCSRSMMALLELFDAQAAQPDRLATLKATELGRLVQEKYSIHYTSDARRHDLEDCLRASHLVRRLPHRLNCYGLTHVGATRMRTMIHKYNPMVPTASDVVLHKAIHQLKLWRNEVSGLPL